MLAGHTAARAGTHRGRAGTTLAAFVTRTALRNHLARDRCQATPDSGAYTAEIKRRC